MRFLSKKCPECRECLLDVKAAVGDRLLAGGALSKEYANSIMSKIDAALK